MYQVEIKTEFTYNEIYYKFIILILLKIWIWHESSISILGVLVNKTDVQDRTMLPSSLHSLHHPSIIFKSTDTKTAYYIYYQSNLSIKPYSIFYNINI
jgi:hypothetical protein